MKFLLWGIVIFILAMWLLRMKKSRVKPKQEQEHADINHAATEIMIRCAQCGVHVPVSEAVIGRSNSAFCSEEHRLKHCAAD
jgi:uncharacterized protein